MAADLITFDNAYIVANHEQALVRYMTLKALGKSSNAALAGAFGWEYAGLMNPYVFINLIETSDAFIKNYPAFVERTKDSDIWSPKISARTLAAIATDQTAKTSDRIAAAKELNVIFNITIVDERGNTRAGRSLADFYADVAMGAVEPGATDASKAH